MRYPNGEEVIVGDRVKLGRSEDSDGVVVCALDRNEYSPSHPKEKWSELEVGALIEFPKYGLIHYKEPEDDLQLISRA
jgi:hypothetical protein